LLWHIVRFRFSPDASEEARGQLREALDALPEEIPELRFARAAPSIDEPDVLGLLSGFDDAAGLAAYQVHPAHLPVVERVRELCDEVVRLDVLADAPEDLLP
jgi:hypothetical protein